MASETLITRLQALLANGMISEVQHQSMQGWTERLARTTAQMKQIVASQDGSHAAPAA